MTDIVERLKDAEIATHALFNYIFQDAREEIERLRAKPEQMERQEPVAEWIENRFHHYPQLEWAAGYKAVIGDKLYAFPIVAPKLDEIKIALQRALELGQRETWTGARKHRSQEDQREEQQCWNKVWSLLDAQPTPSVPDGWLRAIDEALVTASPARGTPRRHPRRSGRRTRPPAPRARRM